MAHLPGYESVQIYETLGRLRLYRHAPRNFFHRSLATGTRTDGDKVKDAYGDSYFGRQSGHRQASDKGGRAAKSGRDNERSYKAERLEGGSGDAAHEDEWHFLPFRPARLFTVLLLDCQNTDCASGFNYANAKEQHDGTQLPDIHLESGHLPEQSCHAEHAVSARQILQSLTEMAPRIRFIQIVRDEVHRRVHALITLDSILAVDRLIAFLREPDALLQGQILFVSSIVLVNDQKSEELLSSLDLVIKDVTGSRICVQETSFMQSKKSDPLNIAHLSHLDTVQLRGPHEKDICPVYCLVFGDYLDALALSQSLILSVRDTGFISEDLFGRNLQMQPEGGEMQSISLNIKNDSNIEGDEEDEYDNIDLFSRGLSCYLAELPTCHGCLSRLDPVSVGTYLGPALLLRSDDKFSSIQECDTGVEISGKISGSQEYSAGKRSPSRKSSSMCRICNKVQIHAMNQEKCYFQRSKKEGTPDTAFNGSKMVTPVALTCYTCNIPENLWICLLCGHVGCGRYTAEHAKRHFHCCGHIFSLELATGRVWDYVEDMFVHSSEFEHSGGLSPTSALSESHAIADRIHGYREDNLHEVSCRKVKGARGKFDGLEAEYSALLLSQLEEQNAYHERLLAKAATDFAQNICQDDELSDDERREAFKIRSDIQKMEEDHSRFMEELRRAEESARKMRVRNQELLCDQKEGKFHLSNLRTNITSAKIRQKHDIQELEAQISDLLFFLRSKEAVQSSELEGGDLIVQGLTANPHRVSKHGRRRRNR